jgi:hypothetical protein
MTTKGNGSFIQKWVRRTREIDQRDNGYVIPLLMGNRPLGLKWRMTVAKAYGEVTWR